MDHEEAKVEALRRVNAVAESRGGFAHPAGLFEGRMSPIVEAFVQLVIEHDAALKKVGAAEIIMRITGEDSAPEKYSEDWLRLVTRGMSWLPNHACGICGVWVGYLILDGTVSYQSACGCSPSSRHGPTRPSSFDEIAEWLAIQRNDEVRDQIMARMR